MFKTLKGNSATRMHFSGEKINIYKSKSAYLRNLSLKGKSIQGGVPKPDMPYSIESVPSKVSLVSCKKNLYNVGIKADWNVYNGFTITISNGKIIGTTGAGASHFAINNNPVKIKSGYIGHKATNNNAIRVLIRVFDIYGNNISQSISVSGWTYLGVYQAFQADLPNPDNRKFFNITANSVAFIKTGYVMLGSAGASETLYDFFLSDEDTDYEAYDGTENELIIKDSNGTLHELYSLANGVKDEVKDGKIIKRIDKRVYDGSIDENWTLYHASAEGVSVFFTTDNNFTVGHSKSVCSHFENKAYSVWDYNTAGIYADHPTVKNKYFCFEANKTVSEWRSWLNNNQMTLLYELLIPKIYDLDSEEYEKFKKILQKDAQTNLIFTLCSISPTIDTQAVCFFKD